MMNIQFVIKDEQVYVIEVNPRASRTVPFLSKVTDIPMAQVATRLILGETLAELGYEDGLYPESSMVHIKAPVFSFTKLAKVDSLFNSLGAFGGLGDFQTTFSLFYYLKNLLWFTLPAWPLAAWT